ncbi:MAG: NTPase [Elusimicrobiota bacterium]
MKDILLTGKPGVGKTTIIKKIIANLDSVGGFLTEEIRENNIRKGFKIATLEDKEGVLASCDIKTNYRVGKYYVNIADLENIAGVSIENAVVDKNIKFIVIDEIGKMELYSQRFQEAVISALNSQKQVIGTIKEKPNTFTDKIKKRQNVEVISVTVENRNSIPDKILADIKGE